ncbi:MAG TPA: hypothetical protein VKU60_05930, partial [Chloroflexota bacterium]|nr:hypothetical protein [Chloroflexota bacterium]
CCSMISTKLMAFEPPVVVDGALALVLVVLVVVLGALRMSMKATISPLVLMFRKLPAMGVMPEELVVVVVVVPVVVLLVPVLVAPVPLVLETGEMLEVPEALDVPELPAALDVPEVPVAGAMLVVPVLVVPVVLLVEPLVPAEVLAATNWPVQAFWVSICV